MIERYYTLEETAKILHRSKHTIVREINKGIIPTHPDFNHIVPKEYIDNWDIETTETFRERRLKQQLEVKDKEIQELKDIIKSMLKIGLEVKL